jgi:hypothetical protein
MYFQKELKKILKLKKRRKKIRERKKIKRDNFWRILKSREKMCS